MSTSTSSNYLKHQFSCKRYVATIQTLSPDPRLFSTCGRAALEDAEMARERESDLEEDIAHTHTHTHTLTYTYPVCGAPPQRVLGARNFDV